MLKNTTLTSVLAIGLYLASSPVAHALVGEGEVFRIGDFTPVPTVAEEVVTPTIEEPVVQAQPVPVTPRSVPVKKPMPAPLPVEEETVILEEPVLEEASSCMVPEETMQNWKTEVQGEIQSLEMAVQGLSEAQLRPSAGPESTTVMGESDSMHWLILSLLFAILLLQGVQLVRIKKPSKENA